ncbi:MAG: hypothetical protein J6B34_01315 [Clostridia bacterium]|nr:hypothetical protein [Clostridia bacterium]
MLYPSIQELLTVTAKDGVERLNKYSITMATAKCARIITNEYIEQRYTAERKIANKETDKDLGSLIKKEYRDEKAVKNALREMKAGEFQVLLPEDEGYEDSIVEVVDYEPPKEETKFIKLPVKDFSKKKIEEEKLDDEELDDFDDFDDEELDDETLEDEEFDSEDLMGANQVYTDETGFTIEETE